MLSSYDLFVCPNNRKMIMKSRAFDLSCYLAAAASWTLNESESESENEKEKESGGEKKDEDEEEEVEGRDQGCG